MCMYMYMVVVSLSHTFSQGVGGELTAVTGKIIIIIIIIIMSEN